MPCLVIIFSLCHYVLLRAFLKINWRFRRFKSKPDSGKRGLRKRAQWRKHATCYDTPAYYENCRESVFFMPEVVIFKEIM